MRRFLLSNFPFTVVLLAGLSLGSCARDKPLQVLGQVPNFELVNQKGAPFAGSSLSGHVWVRILFSPTARDRARV